MKANELQIGDYVNYRGQIIKITSLYDKGGSNEVGWSEKESVWVNADNVEPIPLTPEILEKNGFTLEHYTLEHYSGDVMTGYWWTRNDFVIHNSMNDAIGKNNFKYEYVHQLQHALRLCEIEKTIEL